MGKILTLLLDTHTLLWWWSDDKRLSRRAANAIANEANSVLVGAASAWEIAIKFRLGKLPGAEVVVRDFDNAPALMKPMPQKCLAKECPSRMQCWGYHAGLFLRW